MLPIISLGLVGVSACRQAVGGIPVDGANGDGALDVQMELTTGSERLVIGPLTWQITLFDSGGNPIEGASVAIRGDMNHAGMVPVESRADFQGDGIYTADFEWTMAGDWIVTVTATLPDGRVKTGVYPFTVAFD